MSRRLIDTRGYVITRLALGVLCVLAGVDDLVEALGGMADMFHLDAHHGVIGIGLLTVSREVTELVERAHASAEKLRASRKTSSDEA